MEVICFNGGHLIGRAQKVRSSQKKYIFISWRVKKTSSSGFVTLGLNLTVKDCNTIEIFVTKKHEYIYSVMFTPGSLALFLTIEFSHVVLLWPCVILNLMMTGSLS